MADIILFNRRVYSLGITETHQEMTSAFPDAAAAAENRSSTTPTDNLHHFTPPDARTPAPFDKLPD